MAKYPFESIEKKWQKRWEDEKTFAAAEDPSVPKEKRRYVLDMFPYPSGAGLHVGHPEGYTATDIYCRFLRMRGYNVLHPMGFDAFGLPAENYAIQTGTHPEVTTMANVERFRAQIKSLGFSYDWDREVSTCTPDYYKWTQWIFLQLFKRGLAYESEMPINWCPSCKTGLANEEVKDGLCDRCHTKVTRKRIRQWVLKITAYADRLLEGLDGLDWPEPIKLMQRNWIGRSEGASVIFDLDGHAEKLKSTRRGRTRSSAPPTWSCRRNIPSSSILRRPSRRPPWPPTSTPPRGRAISSGPTSPRRRPASSPAPTPSTPSTASRFRSGFRTTSSSPTARAPSWRCPPTTSATGTSPKCSTSPSSRSWRRPARRAPSTRRPEKCTAADGFAVNSGKFDGLPTDQAIAQVTAWLEERGIGKKAVNYKLRDWLFSRQRYWGEPIPVVHCEKCGSCPWTKKTYAPLLLPEVQSYTPTGTGESPLANIPEWVNTTCPHCGGPAKRETNTMPQWAGSCWYYLRYLDPKNADAFVDPAKEKYWMPVDLYVGGAEHAVLHLLYSRFWHKVLFDIGVVSDDEPFRRLVNQGMILGEDNQKMSKSRGNVVNPDDIVRDFGADSMRVYEMVHGPSCRCPSPGPRPAWSA